MNGSWPDRDRDAPLLLIVALLCADSLTHTLSPSFLRSLLPGLI